MSQRGSQLLTTHGRIRQRTDDGPTKIAREKIGHDRSRYCPDVVRPGKLKQQEEDEDRKRMTGRDDDEDRKRMTGRDDVEDRKRIRTGRG